MKVYRIEINGRGFYNGKAECENLAGLRNEVVRKHLDSAHPSWMDDDLPMDKNYRFAFPSKEKLIEWFGEDDLEALSGFEEFCLLEITVPKKKVKTGRSGKQVVFETGSEKKRVRIGLNDILIKKRRNLAGEQISSLLFSLPRSA